MQLVRLAVSVELEVAVGEGGQGWSDERRGVEVSLAHEKAAETVTGAGMLCNTRPTPFGPGQQGHSTHGKVVFLQYVEGGAPATHHAHAQSRTSAGRSLVDHPRLGFLVAEERRARLALDLQDVEAVDEVVAHDRRLLAVDAVRKQNN